MVCTSATLTRQPGWWSQPHRLPGGVQKKAVQWRRNPTELEAWQAGRTGFPFVDANMRELLTTGFMSNRGRQNVASFLTKVNAMRLDEPS